MQRKLLAKDKLTFKKACEIAQAIELVKRNTCELKAAESRDVQAVNDRHKSVTKRKISSHVQDPKRVVIVVEDNTEQRIADFEQRNV